MNPDLATAQFAEPVWAHTRVGSPRAILQALDSLGANSRYQRDQEVYREESPVGCWYRLISGAARRYAVRPDGRRQIVDVLLPGDMFGFGTQGRHAFSADAIADGSVVARYPIARIEALAASEPSVAQEVRELILKSMERLHALLLVLGRTTAEEKVGGFLLLMQGRFGCGPADRLVLPLTRYDVADYLALSVETVSRCLTTLKQRGVISLSGPRQIGIIDRDALLDRRDIGIIDRDAVLDQREVVDTPPISPRIERGASPMPAGTPQPGSSRPAFPLSPLPTRSARCGASWIIGAATPHASPVSETGRAPSWCGSNSAATWRSWPRLSSGRLRNRPKGHPTRAIVRECSPPSALKSPGLIQFIAGLPVACHFCGLGPREMAWPRIVWCTSSMMMPPSGGPSFGCSARWG